MSSGTPTSILGLHTYKATDDLDYSEINADNKVIDLLPPTVCTSTTRPTASLYQGRLIWEKDTSTFTMWDDVSSKWLPLVVTVAPSLDSNAFTISPGWTLTTGQALERNGTVSAYLVVVKTGSAIASVPSGNINNVDVATINAKYAPKMPTAGSVAATGIAANAVMWTDGGVGISNLPPGVGIAVGDTVTFCFTYAK